MPPRKLKMLWALYTAQVGIATEKPLVSPAQLQQLMHTPPAAPQLPAAQTSVHHPLEAEVPQPVCRTAAVLPLTALSAPSPRPAAASETDPVRSAQAPP